MKKYLILPLSILWVTNMYSADSAMGLFARKMLRNPEIRQMLRNRNNDSDDKIEPSKIHSLALSTHIAQKFANCYHHIDKENPQITPKNSQRAIDSMLSESSFIALKRNRDDLQFILKAKNQFDTGRVIFGLPRKIHDTSKCMQVINTITRLTNHYKK